LNHLQLGLLHPEHIGLDTNDIDLATFGSIPARTELDNLLHQQNEYLID
jgi:hypothetical protein